MQSESPTQQSKITSWAMRLCYTVSVQSFVADRPPNPKVRHGESGHALLGHKVRANLSDLGEGPRWMRELYLLVLVPLVERAESHVGSYRCSKAALGNHQPMQIDGVIASHAHLLFVVPQEFVDFLTANAKASVNWACRKKADRVIVCRKGHFLSWHLG